MFQYAMVTEVDFSAFSRHKGGVHNISNPLPNESSPNWDSYFLTFLFYMYFNTPQFLNQRNDTFQGKKPLRGQQFLKT